MEFFIYHEEWQIGKKNSNLTKTQSISIISIMELKLAPLNSRMTLFIFWGIESSDNFQPFQRTAEGHKRALQFRKNI